MTAPPSPPGRSLLFPLGAALLLGAAGYAVYHFTRPSPAPLTPPDAQAATLEPRVVAAVRSKREEVLKEPTSPKAWGTLGEVFLANDLEDEALVCFAEAERLQPDNGRWPYLRAVVTINRGDREAALPLLRRVIELAGDRDDNLAPRLVLAEALLYLGRNDEAAPHIASAVAQTPTDPRARFDAGLLAVARQDWAAARGHFLACLNSPYARRRARVQLAAVCRRLGEGEKADQFQAEADRMPADADWPDPVVTEYMQWSAKKRNVYKIAESLEAQGQFVEAVRRVGPVVDENPDDDVGQVLLGRLFAQLGNYGAAEQALRRARALAPHKVQAYYYLSLTLVQEGERREARGDKAGAQKLYAEGADQAREALKRKPDYGLAHMSLGLALKHLGKPDEAVAAFEQAVRCNPEHGEIHWHTAEALADAGRPADAIPRFEQALRLAPPGAPWRASAERRLAELKKGGKK